MIIWFPVYEGASATALQLSLASSGAISLYVIVLAQRLFSKDLRAAEERPRLWRSLPGLILSTSISVLFVHLLKPMLGLQWPVLLSGALYGVLSIVLSASIVYALGNEEIRVLSRMIVKRLKKQRTA